VGESPLEGRTERRRSGNQRLFHSTTIDQIRAAIESKISPMIPGTSYARDHSG